MTPAITIATAKIILVIIVYPFQRLRYYRLQSFDVLIESIPFAGVFSILFTIGTPRDHPYCETADLSIRSHVPFLTVTPLF